jgi:hypothetical protein
MGGAKRSISSSPSRNGCGRAGSAKKIIPPDTPTTGFHKTEVHIQLDACHEATINAGRALLTAAAWSRSISSRMRAWAWIRAGVASRVKLESGHRVEGAGGKIAATGRGSCGPGRAAMAVSLLATRSARARLPPYKVRQKRRLPMHSTEQIGPHDLVVVSIGVSTNASTRARCGDFSDELVEVLQQIYLNFLTCFSS